MQKSRLYLSGMMLARLACSRGNVLCRQDRSSLTSTQQSEMDLQALIIKVRTFSDMNWCACQLRHLRVVTFCVCASHGEYSVAFHAGVNTFMMVCLTKLKGRQYEELLHRSSQCIEGERTLLQERHEG